MSDPSQAVPERPIPTIVVEDPPPSVHKSKKRLQWEPIIKLVREQGGKWCRVAEYEAIDAGGPVVGWLKGSKLSVGFEVVTRVVHLDEDKKVVRIYMRCVGNEPPTEPG